MPIDLQDFPAINNHQLGFDDNVMEDFLGKYQEEEVLRRLERLREWMQQANLLNHYGVLLTPVLIEHLIQPRDFEELLARTGSARLTNTGRPRRHRRPRATRPGVSALRHGVDQRAHARGDHGDVS